eukprot:7388138-Prymnesium_polylepis.1
MRTISDSTSSVSTPLQRPSHSSVRDGGASAGAPGGSGGRTARIARSPSQLGPCGGSCVAISATTGTPCNAFFRPNSGCQKMISHDRNTAVMMRYGCTPTANIPSMAAADARKLADISLARNA